jgi:hypothetical protein
VIRDRSQEIVAFHARHFAEPTGARSTYANEHHNELASEEVVKLARDASNAAKFEALWGGDISGYASHSEADQALISLLAFYTQDENQLDSLYRQSSLCREKWLKRSDYRRRTIEKALSNLADTYKPSDDGARMVVTALSRHLNDHLNDHLAEYVQRALATYGEEKGIRVLDKLSGIVERLEAFLDKAEDAGDGLGFRATAAELRKQLELISKLQGELAQEGATTVNIALVGHPDYQRLEELIFRALEHHHQARWDVAEALKELE